MEAVAALLVEVLQQVFLLGSQSQVGFCVVLVNEVDDDGLRGVSCLPSSAHLNVNRKTPLWEDFFVKKVV